MNDDVCFREAGFTDFDDADEAWDADAEGLLDRLLAELSQYGKPKLISEAVERAQSWFRSMFRGPEVFSLREQIMVPIQWDHLPDCVVAFGESGCTLRTGQGHHIFWITMPLDLSDAFPVLAERVAAPHPIHHTALRWDALI